ncbi:hypothetical protein QQF64_025967 [Cirrhinus molitorella]|uniref:Uncharacterized protein n=1 Tax=Cirrhinus molitorella TaxID=172907 RepID=A0ABR3NQU4_9TELE
MKVKVKVESDVTCGQLLESKFLQTDAERELWQTAVVELMSDKEDAIINGRPVWVVRSPPHRNPQLSDLCQQLQRRLEADMQYTCTHHQRLRTDEAAA